MQQHPRELAGNWLAQARRDLDAAEYLFDGARYDAACFGAQQAAAKALKAALIWLAGDRPRTHQLGVLTAEIATYRPGAGDALGDIAALDPYYVTTRYPDAIGGGVPGATFFAPEAKLALERAECTVAYVASLLPPLPPSV
jgi:HEPN domain-containing protein